MPSRGFHRVQRSRWLTLASISGAATALVLGASTCTSADTAAAARAKADDLGNAIAAAPRRAPRVDPDSTLRGDGVTESAEAAARVAQIARAFPSVVHAVKGARFEARLAGVAAMLPAEARKGVPGRARAVLPLLAGGAVSIEDETSDAAISFALTTGPGGLVEDAPAHVSGGVALYSRALGGADVLVVPRASGAEDLVVFEKRPASPDVRYEVDVSRVAGVHKVGRALVFVDARGVPRLRMNPPFVVGADGARRPATVDVTGCAVDDRPGLAWRRAPTPPGAARCTVRIAWSEVGLAYPAVLDPVWQNSTNQMTARRNNTSTLLGSGDVLVAGGYDPVSGVAIASAEVFCPPEKCGVDGIFGQVVAGDMVTARGGHTATAIDDTHVLIVGGSTDVTEATPIGGGEIYDVDAATFSSTATSPARPRVEHTATLLLDGRVLLAGGVGFSDAEIYDPTAGFTQTLYPMH
ncbi:MAG TPA: kelch repeat-containing protein, partial [Byssovorax sp.]